MSLTVGQAHTDPVTGVAGVLYNWRVYGNSGGTGSPRTYIAQTAGVITTAARGILADECEAMAAGLVAVLTTEMQVAVTIHTSDSGLQQYNDGSGLVDTAGPASNLVLNATVT